MWQLYCVYIVLIWLHQIRRYNNCRWLFKWLPPIELTEVTKETKFPLIISLFWTHGGLKQDRSKFHKSCSHLIRTKSNIYLLFISSFFPSAFQICVKTIEDKTIVLDVRPSDTIRDIKNKIQEKEGLKPEYQQLMHMGKPLKDPSKTLSSLNIVKDANIHLFKRTLGGYC